MESLQAAVFILTQKSSGEKKCVQGKPKLALALGNSLLALPSTAQRFSPMSFIIDY
jgi:hypothetical protein